MPEPHDGCQAPQQQDRDREPQTAVGMRLRYVARVGSWSKCSERDEITRASAAVAVARPIYLLVWTSAPPRDRFHAGWTDAQPRLGESRSLVGT